MNQRVPRPGATGLTDGTLPLALLPEVTGRFPAGILKNPSKTFLRLEMEWEARPRQSLSTSTVLISTGMMPILYITHISTDM